MRGVAVLLAASSLAWACSVARTVKPDCSAYPPEDLRPTETRFEFPRSSRAAVSWCFLGGDSDVTAIRVTHVVDDHPWNDCPRIIRSPTLYPPLTVIDSLELEFGEALAASEFAPVVRGSTAAIQDAQVDGPAILAGPGDSGYVFVCRSGSWFWTSWH